jgi:hypothetical protein
MTLRTKTYLISRFQDGDVPAGQDFSDLIQSCITTSETSAQSLTGSLGVAGTVTAASVSAPTLGAANATLASAGVSRLGVSSRIQLSIAIVSGIGTAQNSAAPLATPSNRIFTASANRAFILPGGYPGAMQIIRNVSNVSAYIYPPSGGSINGLANNTRYELPGSARMLIMHETSAYFSTYRCTE